MDDGGERTVMNVRDADEQGGTPEAEQGSIEEESHIQLNDGVTEGADKPRGPGGV